MRCTAVILVLLFLIGTAGCGKKDLNKNVSENSRNLRKLAADSKDQIETISTKLSEVDRDLTSKLDSANGSINAIKRVLEQVSEGDISFNTDGGSRGEQLENMVAEFDEMEEELSIIKGQADNLEGKVSSIRTTYSARTDQQIDMANSEEVAENVDVFMTQYSAEIEDHNQNADFIADMREFKELVLKEYTKQELIDRYRAKLTEQAKSAQNDRMGGWYQDQLDQIDEMDDDRLEIYLNNFRREENMRALTEITLKYNISRTKVRNYGLQVYPTRHGPVDVERE